MAIFSLLFRRFRKSYTLYGSGFGGFGGHTKYRFLNAIPDEKAYWVTSSSEVYTRLSESGMPVLKRGSLNYWVKLAKTKDAFVTHNTSDVALVKHRGLIVHNLWHGVPIKKIGFDSKIEREWLMKKIRSGECTPYEEWDVIYAQSEFHKQILIRAFRLSPEKVVISEPASISYIRSIAESEHEGSGTGKAAILYLPTFRNDGSDGTIVENALQRIRGRFDDDRYELLYKPHPLADSNPVSREIMAAANVVVAPASDDVFTLLGRASILVTDYSSAAYDFFQATERPVFLFQPDLDLYSERVGGLYDVGFNYSYL